MLKHPVAKDNPDPKPLAHNDQLVSTPAEPETLSNHIWLRFIRGRPVSALTTQFPGCCYAKLEAAGKSVLLTVWDNASWHISCEVRTWIRAHNREVKQQGHGVRLLGRRLPIKSLWLNPIEPRRCGGAVTR